MPSKKAKEFQKQFKKPGKDDSFSEDKSRSSKSSKSSSRSSSSSSGKGKKDRKQKKQKINYKQSSGASGAATSSVRAPAVTRSQIKKELSSKNETSKGPSVVAAATATAIANASQDSTHMEENLQIMRNSSR